MVLSNNLTACRNAYYIGVLGVTLNILVFLHLASKYDTAADPDIKSCWAQTALHEKTPLYRGVLNNAKLAEGRSWEVHSPVAIHLGTAGGLIAMAGYKS